MTRKSLVSESLVGSKLVSQSMVHQSLVSSTLVGQATRFILACSVTCATGGAFLFGCDDSTTVQYPQVGPGGGSSTLPGGGEVAAGGLPQVATVPAPVVTIAASASSLTPPPDSTCHFPARYDGNASTTWYLFSQGSAEVNCSYAITSRGPDGVEFAPGNGQYFVAMNTADYSGSAMCGACVEVVRDNGKSVQGMVVDQCPIASNPKCTAGHLDLSKNAFLQIGTEVEGYLGSGNGASTGTLSFRYMPCPSVGSVQVKLKEPNNKYWNEYLVENHRTPIAKFEAQTQAGFVAGVRQPYNYFSVNGGYFKLPMVIRITDINGAVIEATFPAALDGAGRIDLGQQFPACTE